MICEAWLSNSAPVLFDLCENGSVVPVPFPVHRDTRYEYVLDADRSRGLPAFNIAYGGHYAAYAVIAKPIASPSRDSSWHEVLVRVNCAQGTLTLVDLDASLRNIGGNGAADRVLLFDGIALSKDGTRMYAGVDRQEGNTLVDHRLLLWDDGILKTMHVSAGALPYSVRGIIGAHDVVLAQGLSNMLFWMAADATTPTELPGMYGAVRRPGQSAAAGILVVTAGEEAIEFRSPVDGSEIGARIPYSAFVPESLRAIAASYQVSVSADAQWIGCTVRLNDSWADPASACRVYVMRADGSDARYIARTPNSEAPAISGELHP